MQNIRFKTLAWTIALAAALVALPAFAQFQEGEGQPPNPGPGTQPPGPPPGGMRGPGGPRMMMGGPMILLRSDVQKELKITETQKTKLTELLRPQRPGFAGQPPARPGQGRVEGEGPPPLGGALGGQPGQPPARPGQPGQGGQPGQPPMQPGQPGFPGPGGQFGNPEEREKRDREMDEKIKAILNDAQYKRYRELLLQQQGPGALLRREVALALDLRESQRQKMEEIQRDSFERIRPQQGEPTDDPQAMRERFEKNRKETLEKMLAVLTDQQRATWKELVGKEFRFDPNVRVDFPGGPGGPPPPGGGGGTGGGG